MEVKDSKSYKQQLVYAYFINKQTYGISTEKRELEEKKAEFKGNLNYLEAVTWERAVNWISLNRNNNFIESVNLK